MKILEQQKTPLISAIKNYVDQKNANFHVPGHRQGAALPEEILALGQQIFQYDLTELPGLDDLHNPQQAIKEAQELAAKLYGSRACYFLVNGTSSGLVSLILACCRPGDKIILPRNAHRSILTGLILSGARPVYLYPPIWPEFGCVGVVEPIQLADCLQQHPDAKAVMMIHPSYYGVAGNLSAMAKLTKGRRIPLLVDEAHGGHFAFHEQLPPDALSCGADGVVQSTHKVGGSLTQTSMLHVNSDLIDQRRLTSSLRMLQTTSPSYILLASLDGARKQLALKGREMLEQTLRVARGLREKISALPGLKVLDKHYTAGKMVQLDATRLVINVRQTGLTGYQVFDLLSQQYRVQVEMADNDNIICILGLAADPAAGERLYSALQEITKGHRGAAQTAPFIAPPAVEMVLTPSQAWQRNARNVPLDPRVVGKVSADTVSVYPPGIPVLCPGELISADMYRYLDEVRRKKLHVQCSGDGTLRTINVVAE